MTTVITLIVGFIAGYIAFPVLFLLWIGAADRRHRLDYEDERGAGQ